MISHYYETYLYILMGSNITDVSIAANEKVADSASIQKFNQMLEHISNTK